MEEGREPLAEFFQPTLEDLEKETQSGAVGGARRKTLEEENPSKRRGSDREEREIPRQSEFLEPAKQYSPLDLTGEIGQLHLEKEAQRVSCLGRSYYRDGYQGEEYERAGGAAGEEFLRDELNPQDIPEGEQWAHIPDLGWRRISLGTMIQGQKDRDRPGRRAERWEFPVRREPPPPEAPAREQRHIPDAQQVPARRDQPRPQQLGLRYIERPKFPVKFEGKADELDYFLLRVDQFVNEWRHLFPNEQALVYAVIDGLDKGEPAKWVAQLHRERAPELGNLNAFLGLLRERFADHGAQKTAENAVRSMRQGKTDMKQFVADFRRAAADCNDWPERLLLECFQDALNSSIYHACSNANIPATLQAWYERACIVEQDQIRRRRLETPRPAMARRGVRQTYPRETPGRPWNAVPNFKCFRCGGRGHRAVDCTTPGQAGPPAGAVKKKATPKIPRAEGKEAWNLYESSASVGDEVGVLETEESPDLIGKDEDPMVSGCIPPFRISIKLTGSRSQRSENLSALVDTGSSRCLISQSLVEKLGFQTVAMKNPVQFRQVDGSTIGGAPATRVTELLTLELGEGQPHSEKIRFVVLPIEREVLILGLAWLDKWRPTIRWIGGFRRIIFNQEPPPPSHSRAEKPREKNGALNSKVTCQRKCGKIKRKASGSKGVGIRKKKPPGRKRVGFRKGGKIPDVTLSPIDADVEKTTPSETTPISSDSASTVVATAMAADIPQALPGEQQIPKQYRDLAEVFSEGRCDILPPHRKTDCAIELKPGVALPKTRIYSMTPKEMKELRSYIDLNLARGFIEPARSSMAAPVLFKQKKGGDVRLCIDYKKLNCLSIQNKYPLPLMKDMLCHLSKGKIFTKLDLREAYYRIRIKKGDEWKTAFNCPLGQFQYKVMPFGLQGAPAVFMQLINETLHSELYKGVLVYLDDILIYSESLPEHVKLVRRVLKKLLHAKLYVKLSKCDFHKNALDYLGYRITSDGIEMDPAKVKAVLDWQAPTTRKQLQSFLGFANFYRQFIPGFAEVALPLTELLKTGPSPGKPKPAQLLNWTMKCQQSFERLKRMFAKEPILLHPDPDKPFVIQSDASDVAIAAVLLQRSNKDQLLPCAYVSKKLTDTERRWAVWEKEAYAIRWALSTWRQFLEGSDHPFEVWTDHKNLEALKNPRRLSPKQVRWAQFFNRFNFQLRYFPGGKNLLADALSRKPQFNSRMEQIIHPLISEKGVVAKVTTRSQRSTTDAPDVKLKQDLKAALLTDLWFKEHSKDLTMLEELAWKSDKLYVPASMKLRVLERCHDSHLGGHFGFLKTLHLLRRQFWWPRMKIDVQDYVKSCSTCATKKHRTGKPPGLLQPVATPTEPWEEIAMDFIVELPESGGHTVIWTVIDLFSKQAHFVACKGLPSAKQLARLFVTHIYRLHGVPKRIISDRGVQFVAKFWREFLAAIGSSQGLGSGSHPHTSGSAERCVAMIAQYLRCYLNYQQEDWDELLPFAEFAYNNAVHSATGLSPFQITAGKELVAMPELPVKKPSSISAAEWMEKLKGGWANVKKALQVAHEKSKLQADKHRAIQPDYAVGDKVYLSTKYIRLRIPSKKLGPKFLGPFVIEKVINPVTFKLRLSKLLGKIHPVFHCSLLKPVLTSPLRPQPVTPPKPVVVKGDKYYEVKKILDSRMFRGRLQYLVLWKGYPLADSTWVRSGDVNADALINQFHKKFPNKPHALRKGRGGM